MSQVFSILDRVGNTFGPLLCLENEAVAIRACKDLLTKESPVSAHPGDYELHCLAAFDQVSGRITPLDLPQLVVRLGALVQVLPPPPLG